MADKMASIEDRFDAGLPHMKKSASPEEFVSLITKHKIINLCNEEIEEVKKGLCDVGMLDILKRYPEDAISELCYVGLTAAAIKALLVPSFTDDEQKVVE